MEECNLEERGRPAEEQTTRSHLVDALSFTRRLATDTTVEVHHVLSMPTLSATVCWRRCCMRSPPTALAEYDYFLVLLCATITSVNCKWQSNRAEKYCYRKFHFQFYKSKDKLQLVVEVSWINCYLCCTKLQLTRASVTLKSVFFWGSNFFQFINKIKSTGVR